ncbi:MAG: hypothetical protein HY652_15930 [Acidobacteria bacterium]|nr:hypothetical protein [Acidobacteriota bacterium]
MKRLSRVLELTSLAAGAVLFAYVVSRAGPAVWMGYLGTIGWGFAGLLLVSSARHGFRTLAWRASLAAPASLGELYLVRLAGESVRGLTVLGPILGEPAKVWLLRHRVPGMEGARSLVLENLGYALTGGAAKEATGFSCISSAWGPQPASPSPWRESSGLCSGRPWVLRSTACVSSFPGPRSVPRRKGVKRDHCRHPRGLRRADQGHSHSPGFHRGLALGRT